MEWYDFALFGAATTILAAVLAPGGFAVDRRPLGPGRSAAVLAATILLMAFARFLDRPAPAVVGDRAGCPVVPAGIARGAGVLAGGEIGVSVAYVTEVSPPGKRVGRAGGI